MAIVKRVRERRPHAPLELAPSQQPRRMHSVSLVLILGGILLGGILAVRSSIPVFMHHDDDGASRAPSRIAKSYTDLLAMQSESLAGVDIGLMNLLCAEGLPGSADLDMPTILARLDMWAERVRSETERHLYRATDPRYADHYGRSEARLRAEFLVQVLQEDCGVRYNEQRIRNVDFSSSKDLFIHGLFDPANGGTCASMPVLYVAIGHRLGYPIRLVLAKQHIFCRWDDGKERLNIEGTANGGIDFFPDEHYRTWPAPITDAEMVSGEYLVSLNPAEELSVFLVNRAACLQANARSAEARAALAEAQRLMPQTSIPRLVLEKRSDAVIHSQAVRPSAWPAGASPETESGHLGWPASGSATRLLSPGPRPSERVRDR
jgi:hypothetical protein